MQHELVKTGIRGLDAMLYGGIPKNNQIIITGGPGAGKTLLAFEFLFRNAKMGEAGLFVALEEEPQRIISNAKIAFSEIADEIDAQIESGMLTVAGIDPTEDLFTGSEEGDFAFGKFVAKIEDLLEGKKVSRVVIDSASVLEILVKEHIRFRKAMLSLVNNFRRMGITSILTSEMPNPERSKLKFKPEFFTYDGIITLYQIEKETQRLLAIEIIKMRGTKHSFVTTPYDITPEGFRIFSVEERIS
ncbi:MAG: hypothetical protein KGH72_02245 [Candidatus Micrarchaeota archaeon]|nr:hypothetical protein [Candidatus Micrarchaeota archaeon]